MSMGERLMTVQMDRGNQTAEARKKLSILRLSRPPLGKGALLGCNSHDRYSVGAPGFEQEREWWALPSNWQAFA